MADFDETEHEDRKELKKQGKTETNQRIKNLHTMRKLAETPEGRDFLWDWLGKTGVGAQPYSENTHNTAFKCGELNVGNQLLAQILEAAPDMYLVMLQERNEQNADRNRNNDSGRDNSGDSEHRKYD